MFINRDKQEKTKMKNYIVTYRTRKADKMFGYGFGEELIRAATQKDAISWFKQAYVTEIEQEWNQKITVTGARIIECTKYLM